MREGLSESVCRDGFQTTLKLLCLRGKVVSVQGKVSAKDRGRWGVKRRAKANH